MTVPVVPRPQAPVQARTGSAPSLRTACPTCSAASGSACRHVSTGKELTGGVHPLRIRGTFRV